MRTSEQINEIVSAISKLQVENKGAEGETVNPYFKSKYSTLKDIWDSIRISVGKNGLAILQDVTNKESVVSIITTISHSSGQWMEFGPLEIPYAKKDAQAVGSAITYGRRYALCAALGVVSGIEDDDGNEASLQHNYITQEQLEELLNLIGEDEEYRNAILSFYKIKSLAEIQTSKFNAILKSASKRATQRQQAEVQHGL